MTKIGRGRGRAYDGGHEACDPLSRHARRHEPCWGLRRDPPRFFRYFKRYRRETALPRLGLRGSAPLFFRYINGHFRKLPYRTYRFGDSTDAGCALGSALSKEGTMAESELYKKGTAIRSKLMGAKYAENMNKSVYDDPLMKKFGDYAREAVFGMLWDRPGLDLKTKTLICVISESDVRKLLQIKRLQKSIYGRLSRRRDHIWRSQILTIALFQANLRPHRRTRDRNSGHG